MRVASLVAFIFVLLIFLFEVVPLPLLPLRVQQHQKKKETEQALCFFLSIQKPLSLSLSLFLATMMPKPLEHVMTGEDGLRLGGGGAGGAVVLNEDVQKRDDHTSPFSLHDSEMTPGSVPPDEEAEVAASASFGAGHWLGGIGSDFRNLATSIKDTLPPTIGGIANFVHQSAMIIAAEIAQMDEENYQSSLASSTTQGGGSARDANNNHRSMNSSSSSSDSYLHLPWEVVRYDRMGEQGGLEQPPKQKDGPTNDSESIPVFMTDEELMEIILSLSLKESTFLGPFAPPTEEEEDDQNQASRKISFVLDEPRIHLIRRLLDIDGNLAKIHARLSGHGVRETLFWRNYFHHCDQARKELKDRRRNNLEQQSQQSPMSSILASSNKQNSTSCSSLVSNHSKNIYSTTSGGDGGGSVVGGWGCNSLIDSSILESVAGDLENEGSGNILTNQNTNFASSFLTDDSSLVPASLPDDEEGLTGLLGAGAGEDDDQSYVIPSAPNSVNTFATTRSVDDLVLVGREYSSSNNNNNN